DRRRAHSLCGRLIASDSGYRKRQSHDFCAFPVKVAEKNSAIERPELDMRLTQRTAVQLLKALIFWGEEINTVARPRGVEPLFP
ncbi:hypothetical protein, partial [Ensifer sp. ZNC0028]|uniref:hypothetical protein n=1 Tax=Ensifer sp. ZNC0028 TaxID=1339236 RepID=UPI001AEC2997